MLQGETAQKVPLQLKDIPDDKKGRRLTLFSELDRVLGGGLVGGSLVLIGGDPGIGKSTILMQGFGGKSEEKILYVSGEESAQQIKLRAIRLGMNEENLYIFAENNFEAIIEAIQKIEPKIFKDGT